MLSSQANAETGITRISHDQRFKNLILDYPLQALQFFAAPEAPGVGERVEIKPLRQEQLKDRLSDRFWELDVPLEVTWQDGRRETLLYVLEEETEPSRFSASRLASYCLSLSDLMKTTRIVPVVIFLKGSAASDGDATEGGAEGADHPAPRATRQNRRTGVKRLIRNTLELGSERTTYLRFRYIACVLPDLEAEDFWDSPNIVARICLPKLHRRPDQKLQVYARAMSGILTLESDADKQAKYTDFVDGYLPLDDDEQRRYREQHRKEGSKMAGYLTRARAEALEEGILAGRLEGLEQGLQTGRLETLTRQLRRRFGELDTTVEARLKSASSAELDQWIDNILDARSLDEVFRVQ
ncbi:MAG: DUF4351 domain-containing protein [Lautropia sp.]|nr:DUF4351 domain-containing protein [Lautropia sp.]